MSRKGAYVLHLATFCPLFQVTEDGLFSLILIKLLN
jgi:hypothetical protein